MSDEYVPPEFSAVGIYAIEHEARAQFYDTPMLPLERYEALCRIATHQLWADQKYAHKNKQVARRLLEQMVVEGVKEKLLR